MLSRAAVAIVTPSAPRESMCAARGLMLSRGEDRILSPKPSRESMAHLPHANVRREPTGTASCTGRPTPDVRLIREAHPDRSQRPCSPEAGVIESGVSRFDQGLSSRHQGGSFHATIQVVRAHRRRPAARLFPIRRLHLDKLLRRRTTIPTAPSRRLSPAPRPFLSNL